jgi:hypothetical protein
MKHTKRILPLLALLLMASAALAQTETNSTPDTSSSSEEITAAHSRYLQTADRAAEDNDSQTLAQVRDRLPGSPSPPQRGHAHQGSHHQHWMDSGNAGHALIGAAIGFGVGALAGAKANKAPYPGDTARAVFLFGSFGALIGSAIGAAHGTGRPFAHRREIYPPTRPEDKETDGSADALASNVKKDVQKNPEEQSVSAKPLWLGKHAAEKHSRRISSQRQTEIEN